MNPKVTGEFISSLRKDKNLTQNQLADRLGVSNKAISRWETGRGYPDIESFEALSREFCVSINELLYGKRIEIGLSEQAAEKDIAMTYIEMADKKRFIGVIAIILTVILVVVTIFAVFFIYSLKSEVLGSKNCIIAEDYSYMTLFGEEYVPLVLEGAECVLSNKLIDEAQVEGMPFIGKLFFGDSVYSVKECANNDIVYLQTDYDLVISKYYCRENKVDQYEKIFREEAYNEWSAEILTKDWNSCDRKLNENLKEMLVNKKYKLNFTINCNYSRAEGDESIIVHSFQAKGPFRRQEGELLRKKGEYYWFDYDDIPKTQNNGDFSKINAYEIDDIYDDELEQLFSYMFK